MNVIACIPFYNEVALIERCLDSLDGRVDKIILIDGALKHFPLWDDITRAKIAGRGYKMVNMYHAASIRAEELVKIVEEYV